jgi:Ca-activated chloride channel family protein
MKWIKFSKFEGDDLGIEAEDLMRALADFLLESGFNLQFSDWNPDSLDDLKLAIMQALERGLYDDERAQELADKLAAMTPEAWDKLVDNLVKKLEESGHINVDRSGGGEGSVKFQATDKGLDFLGYNSLKDLLGPLGKSSFGRHDTRDHATGIESSGGAKPYEFGDSMNLDVTETMFSAFRREGVKVPIDLEYSDLHVNQSEYQSSCATVLMLDCSHSMILYGEDRFTPAKRVALALTHLIRNQYPGDTLRLVLFHDSAEELRISDLARAQVGPWYTNTREGLILAQRLLQQERKDMKQIVMITDGKPSALTLEDGRIYRNAFGLDPLVIARTLEEVSRCKRQGIMINTFMLASDYGLIDFVQQVTKLCRGQAYFASPQNLGQYLLMEYVNRKTRTVH